MSQLSSGLVMEGGAMRGMFTAGVTDVFMEQNIHFDGAVGVSAGATFGCNLKSHQIGRAIRYNKKYCRDWRYGSFKSVLKPEISTMLIFAIACCLMNWINSTQILLLPILWSSIW